MKAIHRPTIEPVDLKLILELLCTLLSPIGDHRRLHGQPNVSKGKRAKKARKAESKRRKLDAPSGEGGG